MNQEKCAVCETDISYAGSSYGDGVNGNICGACKISKSGDIDDYSYISTLEKPRNSQGVVLLA